MKNKIIHDALILTAITLIAGFFLGLVHDITLEPIAKAEYEKKQAAYRNVFEDAASFGNTQSLMRRLQHRQRSMQALQMTS